MILETCQTLFRSTFQVFISTSTIYRQRVTFRRGDWGEWRKSFKIKSDVIKMRDEKIRSFKENP